MKVKVFPAVFLAIAVFFNPMSSLAQTQGFDISSQDKFYLEFINKYLESTNNKLRYSISDLNKVEQAHVICKKLDSGQTIESLVDSAGKFSLELEENSQDDWQKYIGSVMAAAVHVYCPQYINQVVDLK